MSPSFCQWGVSVYTDSHDSTSLAVWIQPLLCSVCPRRKREREREGLLELCPELAQISHLSSLMDLAKNKRKWRPMTAGWMNEWMNELCCSFNPPKQIPKKTVPDNPRRQTQTFLPRFPTKMWWCQEKCIPETNVPLFPKSRQWEAAERHKRDTKHIANAGRDWGFRRFYSFNSLWAAWTDTSQ